jgi:hypothetical protein
LTLPPDCEFRRLQFTAETPAETQVRVDVLDANERPLRDAVTTNTDLRIRTPLRLAFSLATSDPAKTPKLDSYSLAFDRTDSADRRRDSGE